MDSNGDFAGQPRMLDLIESIYDSAHDATLWPQALARIATAVGGESIALFADFPKFRTPSLLALANFTEHGWSAYNDYYAAINPIMAAGEGTFAAGDTWISDWSLPDSALEKTEFYNDFFLPHNMHYSMGLKIELPGLPAARLSCQRPKSMGAFGSTQGLIFQTIQPHLRRALLLHHRIGALEARSLGQEAALNAHDHAVVGIDAEGKVCLSNQVALDLFTAGDGLGVRGGRLFCTRPEEDLKLQRMLALEMQGAGAHGAPVSALLVSRTRKAQLHLCVLPMRKQLAGRRSSLAALVFIADTARTSSRSPLLRRLYGVTPAEARVADLLLEGLDVREIAHKLSITLETARFQMKQLLAKTGKRRQAELLKLLAALPGTATMEE